MFESNLALFDFVRTTRTQFDKNLFEFELINEQVNLEHNFKFVKKNMQV